jgi:hypothetical protein
MRAAAFLLPTILRSIGAYSLDESCQLPLASGGGGKPTKPCIFDVFTRPIRCVAQVTARRSAPP